MHAPILVFSTDANETLHFDEDEILELAKIQVPSADYATEKDHTAFNGVEELFYKKGSYKNCVMHLSADEVKELQAIEIKNIRESLKRMQDQSDKDLLDHIFLARFISGDPYGVLFIKADTAGVYTYCEFIASLDDDKDTDLHLIQGFDYHF